MVPCLLRRRCINIYSALWMRTNLVINKKFLFWNHICWDHHCYMLIKLLWKILVSTRETLSCALMKLSTELFKLLFEHGNNRIPTSHLSLLSCIQISVNGLLRLKRFFRDKFLQISAETELTYNLFYISIYVTFGCTGISLYLVARLVWLGYEIIETRVRQLDGGYEITWIRDLQVTMYPEPVRKKFKTWHLQGACYGHQKR